MYHENTVYVIGHGKTSTDNAITEQFKIFFIGFVVDVTTDEIIDLSCASTIPTTQNFISSLFIGKKMDQYDPSIEESILRRYFGTSQRAIIIAYKDALKRYNEVKNKMY